MVNLTESELKVIEIVEKYVNEEPVNMFTYDEQVKKIVCESRFILKNEPFSERKRILDILSEVLHNVLYDTFEECMRDENIWNNYFISVLREIPVVVEVAEIDVENADVEVGETIDEEVL